MERRARTGVAGNMRGLNWSYVLAAFGCLFVVGLLDNSRGPLFPDVLSGLLLSDAQGAWLFAAASAAGGVGSVLGRHLLRVVRPLRGLQAGLLTATSGMYVLGTSASLESLVTGSALFGLSFGLLSLVQGTLVQRGTPPAAQRRVFSGLHSMYGAASFLSPLVVMGASRAGLDWRATFRLLACAPLVLLVVSFALRDPALPVNPYRQRRGIQIVADNALDARRWTPDPAPPGEPPDDMDTFNRLLAADKAFSSMIVPLGNGLLVAVRQ